MIDVSGIASGIGALIELIIRGLFFLTQRAFCLVAYACSKTYREEKNSAWRDHRFNKYFSLGLSGLCLLGLICITVWVGMQFKRNKQADLATQEGQPEFRWQIHTRGNDSNGRPLKVTIKDGSISNLIAAHGLADLAKKFKENLVVVGETNHLTNVTVTLEFHAGGSEK